MAHAMRIGAIFPQTELGGDAGAVRAYAQGVDQLGYAHLLAYDHVIGPDPEVHKGWDGPYNVHMTFHEPFVLFGYIAAITSMELVTGVVILPQRQTVLAAKQAAEVDLLAAGRFRLGVGLGWNAIEYESLGKDFSDRGVRVEEQITLMRRLWSEQSVTHDGPSERVIGAGLAPLPIQRPIPIWFGGLSPRAYRRIGRLADGWFPMVAPGPELDKAKTTVDAAALEAGRDPDAIGMEGRANWGPGGLDAVISEVEQWRSAGATHLAINTMDSGFRSVDEHLAALASAANNLGLTTS
jgi:probable F420-dependent oxidoreductase